MKQYLKENIEWLKSFLSETYVNGKAGKASSKRVFEAAIIWVFLFGFIRVTLATVTLLDMPWGWFAVIMGILGLKMYENYKNGKNGNGNGNGNATNQETEKHDDGSK